MRLEAEVEDAVDNRVPANFVHAINLCRVDVTIDYARSFCLCIVAPHSPRLQIPDIT